MVSVEIAVWSSSRVFVDVSGGPDGRAGGVVKLPVVRRWILLSDLQYIRTTCLGSSFFTKSWRAVEILEYVDVEPRRNINGG